jgi:hypothetical protein
MKPSRAPLILAIVLLLLPVLYVGSYLALVNPVGTPAPFGGVNYYRVAGAKEKAPDHNLKLFRSRRA